MGKYRGSLVLSLSVMLLMGAGTAGGNVVSASGLSLEVQRENKQSEIDGKSVEVSKYKKEIDETWEKVEKAGKEIDATNNVVAVIEDNIIKVRAEIREMQESIIELQDRISQRDIVLRQRVQALQTRSGSLGYFEVLLGSTSFSDFVDRYSMVRTLMDADRGIMKVQQADKELVENEQQVVEVKVAGLETDHKEMNEKLKEVEKAKIEMGEMIEKAEKLQQKAEADIGVMEEELADIIEMEAEVERSIIAEQAIFYNAQRLRSAGAYCNADGMNKNSYQQMFKGKGVLDGQEDLIIRVAEESKIDPVLMAAIVMHETGHGTSNAIKLYNNPGGLMSPSSNWSKLTRFETLSSGMSAMGRTMSRIVNKEGKKTIQEIGAVYAPVGADNDPTGLNGNWVRIVTEIVSEFGGLVSECEQGDFDYIGDTSGEWVVPVSGRLTSHFGWRVHPITGVRKQHRGLDIANISGTPIYAAADGIVSEARSMGGLGNVVMITHTVKGKVMTTVYAHMSAMGTTKGMVVRKGQEIGRVGTTGLSTGPHLHFEVHNGYFSGNGPSAVNPLRYIPIGG